MDERRGSYRIPVSIKFSYQILSAATGTELRHLALTKNMSAKGLLFESQEEMSIGTRLKLFVDLLGKPSRTIELEAEVARVERLLDSGYFDIGVFFINTPAAVAEDLKIRVERMDVLSLLSMAVEKQASDLHLTTNSPPMMRLHGVIKPLELQAGPLSSEEIEQMVYSVLSDSQKKRFREQKDLDFAFVSEQNLRYRVSVYQQRGNVEVVFRIIPSTIKNIEELGLPQVVESLCRLTNGIVIIAGSTGSGKTTTITTMIDIINKTKGGVILSLEKPIEYTHKNIKGIVKQREVGFDVPSFAAGLTAGLRQDPDVIVVGEIIDCDTLETALNAAETGHLVISSIHAANTVQVLDRLISLFPLEQQVFISGRLSHCLKAIITQALLPHKNGYERVLAAEVCTSNYAVMRVIYDRNFSQLSSILQSGASQGMQLMQSSVDKIFEQGLITGETYEIYSKKR
ncbi:PilT/PilU family type 4a pilus ATPase [Candidatus Omnitrophota bacterium]